jgi:hypothetical protein
MKTHEIQVMITKYEKEAFRCEERVKKMLTKRENLLIQAAKYKKMLEAV